MPVLFVVPGLEQAAAVSPAARYLQLVANLLEAPVTATASLDPETTEPAKFSPLLAQLPGIAR
jgi:hypothetical protein